MKYTEKELKNIQFEANRCLYCYDAECIKGCPADINIPEFIKGIRENDLKRASRLIYSENPFGAVCGEICPTDQLCRKNCVLNKMNRPINIPLLQRFAVEHGFEAGEPNYIGKKIAVIGGGPGGLAVAEFLARKGMNITLFEQRRKLGGVLRDTLPAERLSDIAIEMDIEKIRENKLITIKKRKKLGKDINLKKLMKEYDYAIIATGCSSREIEVPGIGHKNVYFADKFLKEMRKKKKFRGGVGQHVVVIGGGDVAMDSAFQARKVANKVSIFYRRSRDEMPCSPEERRRAEDMGVTFNYLTGPKKISRNNKGELFITFSENRLEKVKRGRPKPVEVEDTEYKVKCDKIVFAVGQQADNEMFKKNGIGIENGLPEIGDDYQTRIDNVFLVGDVVNGGGTVVEAVRIAKEVTEVIMDEI